MTKFVISSQTNTNVPSEGPIEKIKNAFKAEPLKYGLIVGGVIVGIIILIIIIAVCASGGSSSSKSDPKPDPKPYNRDEAVEKILTELPARDKVAYADFKEELNKKANEYKLDEDGKTWLCFRWIAENIKYDSNGASGNENKTWTQGTGDCYSYARIFIDLNRALGFANDSLKIIEGETRSGDCKNDTYVGGLHHYWSAILMNDGKWNLFDSRRGAGSGNGESFKKAFNPYYFRINPEWLIVSHWPYERENQFINPTLSEEEYCTRATFYPDFYINGFTKVDPNTKYIYPTSNTGKIKYYFSDPNVYAAAFFNNPEGKSCSKCYTLTKYSNYYELNYTLNETGKWTNTFAVNTDPNSHTYMSAVKQYIISS